jgi:hypothetical protein
MRRSIGMVSVHRSMEAMMRSIVFCTASNVVKIHVTEVDGKNRRRLSRPRSLGGGSSGISPFRVSLCATQV